MGRLKGGANNEAEAEKLSLRELNKLIAHAEFSFKTVHNAGLRKSAFTRLTWLEVVRERIHGVAAPPRRFPRRS